jgi:hypothetical protein
MAVSDTMIIPENARGIEITTVTSIEIETGIGTGIEIATGRNVGIEMIATVTTGIKATYFICRLSLSVDNVHLGNSMRAFSVSL